jgi:hypothetical protein
MADPARKNAPVEEVVICHAYPLACSGVSAARSAVRRSAFGLPPSHRRLPEQPIPDCTHGRCYLFEEIHPAPEGSEQ